MSATGAAHSELLPGLDLLRLGEWIEHAVPGADGEDLTARLIAGGKSNLTYELSDGRTTWVLRRPPVGEVLATAHDVGREYRVMAALAGTGVPVPAMVAFCDEREVIGAPFALMEYVDGAAYNSAAELRALGEQRAPANGEPTSVAGTQRTHAIGLRLVDTLAALHRVDPAEVGLGDLGRPDGYLQRQVRRWSRQFEASLDRPLPGADELHGALAARAAAIDAASGDGSVPAATNRSTGGGGEPAGRIVHGDFRLDNVLFDGQDRPRAVIDWEMATLGDPLADLGLLLAYQQLARLPGGGLIFDAAAAPGYPTADEQCERYAAASGREPVHLGFHLALACYKLAAITEGIHHRRRIGQTVGAGFDGVEVLTEPLLAVGLDALNEVP